MSATRAALTLALGGKQDLPPVRRPSYRETPDVAAATARLIRSVGKRVATEDPDGLESLEQLDRAVRDAWSTAVAGLRASGFTDRDLGRQLGMTRQAIEQRWPRGERS